MAMLPGRGPGAASTAPALAKAPAPTYRRRPEARAQGPLSRATRPGSRALVPHPAPSRSWRLQPVMRPL